MSYSEKYELAIKPYIKITDCIKILGTNSNVFKPRWIAMVKDLEKQTNMKFGPWGIPNKLVMDYLGLDIELLRMNAEYEKKAGAQ